MKQSEYETEVVPEINARWPLSPWPELTAQLGWEDLKDFEKDAVLAAIRDYAASGERFPPTSGQIVAIAEPPYPRFSEMWPMLQRAMGQIKPMEPTGATLRRVENMCGPLVAGWLQQFGVENMMHAPVEDATHGGAVRHRIRQDYEEAMRDSASRRRLEALAPSARRAQLTGAAASITRRGELNRFDPEEYLPSRRGDDDDDGGTAV
jgi:hypothetical protein